MRLVPSASFLIAATLGGTTLAACVHGAPPGYRARGQQQWTLPLVAPLEATRLVTPVFIDGHGPYLFALDPDAPLTSIDAGIAHDLALRVEFSQRETDETDTTRPRGLAFTGTIAAGDLVVDDLTVAVHPDGALDIGDLPVRGILGRDVIAESVVFGVDRDRGVATLTTHEAFTPPAGAHKIAYGTARYTGEIDNSNDHFLAQFFVPSRRVTRARINGHAATMHIDLGAWPSQLREAVWHASALPRVPAQITLADEVGTRRRVNRAAIAAHVAADGATSDAVLVVDYRDHRFESDIVDGTLGLDFFAPFRVAADWHHKVIYLVPRDHADHGAERLARWGAALPCAASGCADVVVDGRDLRVTRKAGVTGPLEITLAIGDPHGARAQLVAVLPVGVDAVTARLDAAVAPAVEIQDLAPIARACPTTAGCVVTP